MPKLNIDQFDTEPSVGQKVRVEGEVKSIDQDTGEVEVSYDKVETIDRSESSEENSESSDNSVQGVNLDDALKKSFNYTQ